MFAIFLELIARFSFTAITIVNKASRNAGVTTFGVMGQYAWGLPFFALLGIGLYLYDPAQFRLGGQYWMTLGIWVALCVALNYIGLFVMRYQALTELGGYKLGFVMLVSLAIDRFWYGETDWSFLYILGGIIATFGGWLLTMRPVTQEEKDARIPLPFPVWVLFVLIFTLAALMPIGYAFYKDCLTLAAHNPLLHTIFGQSILFAMFWAVGGKDYTKARAENILPRWRVIVVASCVLLAALVQTWSIAGLSVTSIMVLTLLGGALLTANDMLTKELAPTKHNIASIALVFLGAALIGISQF